MRPSFAKSVLDTLVDEGHISRRSSVLAVCAGEFDRLLFSVAGFSDVCLTNIDPDGTRPHGEGLEVDSTRWEHADVHALPYDDASFDLVWVSDGIHHCRSPHLAVTEMYRVARTAIAVVESRDSLAMRAAYKVGASPRYEINGRLLETREQGGVDFGAVPNFIYRWTEREFEKLLDCYDPVHRLGYEYFYSLSLPEAAPAAVKVTARLVARIAPTQGNTFGMVALKDAPVQPYLEPRSSGFGLRDDVRTGKDAARALRQAEDPRRVRHTIPAGGRWDGWPSDVRPGTDDPEG